MFQKLNLILMNFIDINTFMKIININDLKLFLGFEAKNIFTND